jgi:hypothetical protein
MRGRYGYYGHLSSLSGVPCPYQSPKRIVTYFEKGKRVRRTFDTEEEATEFKAALPKSAQAVQHSP